MRIREMSAGVLAAALMCSMAACSADKTTGNDADKLKEYITANADGCYWEHHDNLGCYLSKYENDEKHASLRFYQDEETYIWIFENGDITCGRLDSYLYIRPDGDQIRYITDLTDRDELYELWYNDIHDRDYIVLNDNYDLLETTETDDGIFEALVEISDPVTCRQLAESEAPDLPEDFVYEDGIRFRYLYRFDIETKDLLGYIHYSVDTNGDVRTLAECEYRYDEAKYDPFAEGEPFHEYKSMQEDPELSRRVTITFDPDTGYENVREFVVPKIAEIGIYYRDGEEVTDLFTDRECTVPYVAGTDTGDLVLYAPDKSGN